MPRFIIEREVGTLTEEQLQSAAAASIEALDTMEGVVWIRSYVSHEDGKIYCEYDAPDEDAVREHARRAGLPVDRVAEVALEISPSMFR